MSHSLPHPQSGLNTSPQAGCGGGRGGSGGNALTFPAAWLATQLPAAPSAGKWGAGGARTWIPSPWSRLRAERGQRCHLRPEPAVPVTLFRSTPFSGPGTDISPKQLSFLDSLSLWSSGPRRAGMEPKQEALGCGRPSKRGAGGRARREDGVGTERTRASTSPQMPAGRKDAESDGQTEARREAGVTSRADWAGAPQRMPGAPEARLPAPRSGRRVRSVSFPGRWSVATTGGSWLPSLGHVHA